MIPNPSAIYFRAFALIFVSWLVCFLTILPTMRAQPPLFIIGLVIAAIFQQSVLAGAWAALGPGKLQWRWPMSFGWACLMGSAIGIPIFLDRGRGEAFLFPLLMVGLWLASQLPVWALSLIFGLRLRHQGTEGTDEEQKQRQFGIAQLLWFTTFVAVLLGLLRLLLSSGWLNRNMASELPSLIFVLVAQIVISLPLLLAALLPKRAVVGSLVALLFMVVVTIVEAPLARSMQGGGPSSEADLFFPWLNFYSALWVIAFAVLVRRSGYHFGVPEPQPDPQAGMQFLKTTIAAPASEAASESRQPDPDIRYLSE